MALAAHFAPMCVLTLNGYYKSAAPLDPSMTNDVRELTRELVSISSHEDETAAGDAIEAWLR